MNLVEPPVDALVVQGSRQMDMQSAAGTNGQCQRPKAQNIEPEDKRMHRLANGQGRNCVLRDPLNATTASQSVTPITYGTGVAASTKLAIRTAMCGKKRGGSTGCRYCQLLQGKVSLVLLAIS